MKPPGSGLLFVGRLFSVSTLVLVIGLFISFERLYFILGGKKKTSHTQLHTFQWIILSNHQSNNHMSITELRKDQVWNGWKGRKKRGKQPWLFRGSKTTAQKTILKATQLSRLEHQLFLSAYNAPRPGTALTPSWAWPPQSSPQLCWAGCYYLCFKDGKSRSLDELKNLVKTYK